MTNLWVPNVSVGPFVFGAKIESLVDQGVLVRMPLPSDIDIGWESYETFDGMVHVSIEYGLIVSVACYKEIIYGGRNLIGLSVNEFLAFMGRPYDEIGDLLIINDEHQGTFEYDGLGLQAWWSSEQQVMRSFSVSQSD